MSSLSSDDLRRDYRRFALPSIAGLAIFSLYSMVDGIFVGRLVGAGALAAVNLSLPFLNLLFSLAILLAVGAGTLIATALGEKNTARARALFSQNVATAALLGLLLGLLVRLFCEPVCRALGADAETLADTRAYVGTIALFAPCFVLEYNLEVLAKTDGHPRLAMLAVLLGCAANVVMDWLFIGPLGMGVFGAALATGLSQALAAALLLLAHFLRGKNKTLSFGRFRMDFKALARMLPIGLSDGSMELCVAGMTWLYNRLCLAAYGTDGVAAYTVLSYVNLVMLNVLTGCSQALQPLVSYHVGAGEQAACRKLLGYALRTQALLGLAGFVLLELGAPLVAGLFFAPQEEALRLFAAQSLRRYSFAFLLLGFNLVAAGYLAARERPAPALCVSLGRGFAVQALSALALFALFGGAGIWWAAVLSELMVAGVSMYFLRRGG